MINEINEMKVDGHNQMIDIMNNIIASISRPCGAQSRAVGCCLTGGSSLHSDFCSFGTSTRVLGNVDAWPGWCSLPH